ncbi:class I adenylate-forming enzyme family protein [Pseudoalteromonas sp. MMG012]|uniref:class I adenylate-forming enzyme family protein n=1 Tax=Pseudoalteromonas sp. MMG012 TaxID=2822686 RepID=UPI001B39FFB2|nr:class I adenylate-forming enzyme family protein [Pseudoalteromonas sp. MMG012]MBQ4849992.1 acyl--CoA ligase [Pseudoalteromonas sp. MMG012]
MRFINLIKPNSTWVARYKDDTVDAEYVSNLLATVGMGPLGELSQEKLHVFCVFNPLQALLSYFVGSHLGLTCAVVSPRSLDKLLDGFDKRQLGTIITPLGRRSPSLPADVEFLALNFSPPLLEHERSAPDSHRPARFIFCTSGSTGKAKRVVHCETSLVSNAKVVAEYLRLSDQDHSYCVFPMQYMYGLSTSLCALHSNSIIEYGDFVSPALVASYVKSKPITVLPLLGEWSHEVSQEWRRAYTPKRLILLNASDRLLESQAAELLPWATEFWNNLGQTESAPRIFALELKQFKNLHQVCHNNTVSVGYPVDKNIEVKLVNKNATTGVGNLYYKTPFKMLGYLQDNGDLQEVGTYSDSGDLFVQDDQGRWHWVARSSHTIKVNGELVPLTSVTNKILNYKEVSGVGYVTNKKGELCTFIESSTMNDALRVELTSLLTHTLRGKRSRVSLVHKLPRTENGKLDLSELRQKSLENSKINNLNQQDM